MCRDQCPPGESASQGRRGPPGLRNITASDEIAMWSLEHFCSVVGVPKGPWRLAPGFNLGMPGPTVLSERAKGRRQSMRLSIVPAGLNRC